MVIDRAQGTCEWFLAHSKYQRWLSTEPSALLWVTADPGCGKSVLSKFLLDHFRKVSSNAASNFCYFFFKDESVERRSPNNALCAMLHQLFSQKVDLIKHAAKQVKANGDKLPGLFESLWEIFAAAVTDPGAGTIICVIDALDECESESRAPFVKKIASLYQQSRTQNCLKLIITSRPDDSIDDTFWSEYPAINSVKLMGENENEANAIQDEIDHVIAAKINHLKVVRQRHGIYDDAHIAIHRKITTVQNRTYLWVSLIFPELELKTKRSKRVLLQVLTSIPVTVEETYQKILEQSLDPLTTKKILQIVLAAIRPLTVAEMRIALAINGEHKSINDMDLEPEATFSDILRKLCGLFVTIIDSRVYLIHQTAREFLLANERVSQPTVADVVLWKHSIDHKAAHSVLAEACITYILLPIFDLNPLTLYDTPPSRDKSIAYMSSHTFLGYAAYYWMDHASQADMDENPRLAELAYMICDVKPDRSWTWDFVRRDEFPYAGLDYDDPHRASFQFNPLFVGCYSGLAPLVELWLQHEYDQDLRQAIDWSVAAASQRGHRRCLDLIFDHGYDPGMRLGTSYAIDFTRTIDLCSQDTSLHNAARHGQIDIVQMLLGRHVYLDSKNSKGWTAFKEAREHKCRSIARMLLDEGADPAPGSGAVLSIAARDNSFAIVQLLLECGADPNSSSEDPVLVSKALARDRNAFFDFLMLCTTNRVHHKIPLLEATTYGVHQKIPLLEVFKNKNKKMAMLLINHGASIDVIVRILLEGDTGLTACSSALSIAVTNDLQSIVKLLLECGADPNNSSGGQAILWKALDRDWDAFFDFLVKFYSDIATNEVYREMPLLAAVQYGNEEMAKLLIEHGARMDVGEFRSTPSPRAVFSRRTSNPRLLIENNADVDLRSHEQRTLLHSAAEENLLNIAQILIARGANMEAKDHDSKTPLHLAAAYGHGVLVKYLIDKGAGIDCIDKNGRTPLSNAAEADSSCWRLESDHPFPHAHTVRVLLNARANPNILDLRGWSPLTYAKEPNLRSSLFGSEETLAKFWIERGTIAFLLRENGADETLGPQKMVLGDGGRCLTVPAHVEAQGNFEGQFSRAGHVNQSNRAAPVGGSQKFDVEREMSQPVTSDTEDSMDGKAPNCSDVEDSGDVTTLPKRLKLPPAAISELAVILALSMVHADHGGVGGDTGHVLREEGEETKTFLKKYLSNAIFEPWERKQAHHQIQPPQSDVVYNLKEKLRDERCNLPEVAELPDETRDPLDPLVPAATTGVAATAGEAATGVAVFALH